MSHSDSKSAKQQKYCIFCGGTPLSKEHIFPNWLGKLTTGKKEIGHGRINFRDDGTTTMHEIAEQVAVKQGPARNLKYRVVCETCNNTWMSEVERDSKSILLRMMNGKPSELSAEEQTQLYKWIILKATLIDSGLPDGETININHRAGLLSGNFSSENWTVWVAQSEMEFGQCGLFRSSAHIFLYPIRRDPTQPPNANKHNCHAICLFSGAFLGVAVYSVHNRSRLTFKVGPEGFLLPLCARQSPLSWPSPFKATLGDMNILPVALLESGKTPFQL